MVSKLWHMHITLVCLVCAAEHQELLQLLVCLCVGNAVAAACSLFCAVESNQAVCCCQAFVCAEAMCSKAGCGKGLTGGTGLTRSCRVCGHATDLWRCCCSRQSSVPAVPLPAAVLRPYIGPTYMAVLPPGRAIMSGAFWLGWVVRQPVLQPMCVLGKIAAAAAVVPVTQSLWPSGCANMLPRLGFQCNEDPHCLCCGNRLIPLSMELLCCEAAFDEVHVASHTCTRIDMQSKAEQGLAVPRGCHPMPMSVVPHGLCGWQPRHHTTATGTCKSLQTSITSWIADLQVQ